MKKYLAYDAVNGEYEHFDEIGKAQKHLENMFLADGSYHPDLKDCAIFKLCQKVDYDVVEKKSDYEYEREEDVPEGDEDSEAWPYDCEFDEIWKHKFVNVKKETI